MRVSTRSPGRRADPNLGREKRRIDKVHHVRERRSKEGAIHTSVTRRFWRIYIFASPTVQLDGFFVGHVGKSDGEERVAMAQDTRTTTKLGFLEFL